MAFNLKDDPRMRQRLEGAVGLSPKDIDAPAAELPPLSSISVKLSVPDPPGEMEILERYRQKLRDLAVITSKKPGEPVALGDEVCVCTVGHIAGAIFAGSIRNNHWMEMVPDDSLPGFVEQLAGMPVGGAGVIPVVVGDKVAAMAVRVAAAQSVDMPDPEDPASLGVADTLEGTLEVVGRELLQEAEEATPLRAMNAVMKELATRAVVEVPSTAVDAEIQRVWRLAEGDACIALGLTVDEQQEALKLWLADAGVRAEATERLKSWAALKAVVANDALTPTPEGWRRFLQSFAPVLGQTREFLQAEIDKDPKVKAELAELAFQMQVVDHVMESVRVEIVEKATGP